MVTVSDLHIYPVKGLSGISLQDALLTDRGFQHDRRWMLINDNNKFLSQRECSAMCLLKTRITEQHLMIYHSLHPDRSITVPLVPVSEKIIQVTVWDDVCPAMWLNADFDKWFTDVLNISCRLIYMPNESKRFVDNRFAFRKELTAFSDGFPVSLIGKSSLEELNNKMKLDYKMDRFRPNIVVEGSLPFEEDEWKSFTINDINFSCVKPLARCPVTTINQQTAARSKEPLQTLATFRFANNKVYFGQNVLYDRPGTVSIGMRLFVNTIGNRVI